MISIHMRPPQILLSDAPAWFEVSNTGEDKKVQAVISTGGQQITSLYSFASVNNRAYFELSEVFSSVLDGTYEYSVMQGQIAAPLTGGLFKTFSVVFSDSLENELSEEITVVAGSLSPDLIKKVLGANFTFTQWLEQHPFLTFRPKDINVYYPGQTENLYLCSPVAQGSITASMTISFCDGTGFSKILGSFTPAVNTVYKIFCSYEAHIQGQLPSDFDGKKVSSYKIWFSSSTNGLLKTFHYHYMPSDLAKGCFVFLNSIGGYDTFCPMGAKSISSSVSLDYDHTIIAPESNESFYRVSGHKTHQVITQNTGMLPASQAKWLSQLIFSKRALWRPRSGGVLPISLIGNKLDFKEVKSKLYAADIKYIINPVLSPEVQ